MAPSAPHAQAATAADRGADTRPPASEAGGRAPSAVVTVRYWAAARSAAGVESERQSGDTVGAVVDAAVAAHPPLAPVARAATFLVDGRAAGRHTSVAAGATVEVLPPFAGG